LNTNHAVVGYYTARSWRLPEHVCEAIANHHNALSIFGDESARDTQLKNLLAILSAQVDGQTQGAAAIPLLRRA
ncbi:HDOD domain-containing protein, partial [Staphylococcus aureus]|uniref:HDOD domain-containing protein n=1 Tax=Staphylococcus aureus TaxID=1280 RepID=UPI002040C1D1